MRAIKKQDLENLTYYQVPKWLMDIFLEKKITPGAFQTYVLMYDRIRLSAKNNWIDKNGDVFIKYSWEEMQCDLKVNSMQQIKRNLDKLFELNLLEKKKHFSSTNTYYLNVYDSTLQIVEDREEHMILQNVEDSILQNVETNKNNYNKNNFNKNNYSFLEKVSLKESTIKNINKIEGLTEEFFLQNYNYIKNNDKLGEGLLVKSLETGKRLGGDEQARKKEKESLDIKKELAAERQQQEIKELAAEKEKFNIINTKECHDLALELFKRKNEHLKGRLLEITYDLQKEEYLEKAFNILTYSKKNSLTSVGVGVVN